MESNFNPTKGETMTSQITKRSFTRNFTHPLTCEGAAVRATFREGGEIVVRVYYGSDAMDGPSGILRTHNVVDARRQWTKLCEKLLVTGFEKVSDGQTGRIKS